MKKPFVSRLLAHHRERGVTMILVAIAMVAIIGMAVLSIDVIVLYLAKEEAQRSADAAALAAARVISLSGITGDPTNLTGNWGGICGAGGVATVAAQAVAAQNIVGNQTSATVAVSYSAGTGGIMGAGTADCSSLSGSAFGVNPLVTVKVTQAGLPNFFSRIWSHSGNSVSATATAEAFNPSNSLGSGNQTSGTIIPVTPRCVKPWAIPNQNPLIPAPNGTNYCNMAGGPGACNTLVGLTDGSITNPGISLNGGDGAHVIGETFWLVPDCDSGNPNNCKLLNGGTLQPQANFSAAGYPSAQPPPNLLSAPGEVGNPVAAVPSNSSCSGRTDVNQEAIAGCDSPVNYSCGVANANVVDLTKHDPGVNSITDAVLCLIHQTDDTALTSSSGQDYLEIQAGGTFGAPSAFPFHILAGGSNPVGAPAGTQIMSSNSIVSLPIYDQTTVTLATNTLSNVTFIGFLQVFINAVDANGNRLVTVLNVTGCGNGSKTTALTPLEGSSPVPVRLITPP